MTEWVLWGSHPSYADGVPIRLTGGSLADCRRERRWRESDGGWYLLVRKAGEPFVHHLCGCAACVNPEHLAVLP